MQQIKFLIKIIFFEYFLKIFKKKPSYKTYSLREFCNFKKNRNRKKVVVHMIWISGKLTQIEIMCINSFIKHGFEVNIWTNNNNLPNAPHKINVIKIPKIFSIKNNLSYSQGSNYALNSDILRIQILYKYGGLYADTDMICNIDEKKFSKFFTEPFLCSEKHHISTNGLRINNNLMFFPKSNNNLLSLINNFYMNYFVEKNEKKKILWGIFGGSFFTVFAENFPNYLPLIMKPEFSNPVPYWKSPEAFLYSNIRFSDQTAFIHLYNERWKVSKINKNRKYKSGSIIDLMLKKYSNYK